MLGERAEPGAGTGAIAVDAVVVVTD
jgi:hypothetical protein